MSTALLVHGQGPGTPCGPPLPGAPVTSTASTTSTPLPTPFDGERVAVSVGAIVVLLAVVAVLFVRRRRGRIGGRVAVFAGVSLAFAALVAAWIWQLKTSYVGGGCVIFYNASPFSEDQASTLAPLLTLLVCVLALAWIVVALISAFARRAARA